MNKKLYQYLFFFIVLIAIYSIIGVGKYLHYTPAGLHHWAQSDRASIAYTYYQYNNSFFLPMTFNYNNGNGITGVEFPIIYYSVAQLYKIFGFNDFIFRFFTLALTIISFFYFIELIKLFNKNFWLILLGIIILYTSPIFIYYSFSFLPDIYALNLFIIALYYFEKYRRTDTTIYLVLYAVLICLSILIKITFAIYLIALLTSFTLIRKHKFITKEKILLLVLSCISLIVCYSWYSYSKNLNVKYNSGVFLMDFKPSENFFKYIDNMLRGFKTWFTDFINSATLLLISTIFIYLIINIKKLNKFYTAFFIISTFGVIIFTYLFSFQYIDHDYYYIQFYSLIIIVYLIFVDFSNQYYMPSNALSKSIVIALFICSIIFLKFNISDRFNKDSRYNNYSSYTNTINLIGIDKELDKLNIPLSAKFVVFDDPSMNISLYYMKRFGVQMSYLNDKGTIDWYMSKSDIDYVLINNNNLVENTLINHWLGALVLKNDHYSVYKKNR